MKYDTYLGSFFDKSLWSGGLAAFPDFFYIKKEKKQKEEGLLRYLPILSSKKGVSFNKLEICLWQVLRNN